MSRRVIRHGEILVFPVKDGVDVFTGTGWTKWTRFNTTGGYPQMVAGTAISEKEYATVFNLLVKGA